ncbi:MAG: Do family serine endopeptidase [Pseudomonadota bacterium]
MPHLIRRVLLALLAITISYHANATVTTPVATPGTSLAPMLQSALPAVVNIRADIKITDLATLNRLLQERGTPNNGGEIPDTFLSVASGVIVNADKGYILTNAHVVNDAQTVIVSLGDGRHYTARIVGMDKPSDIALLQIKGKKLTAVPVGNSNGLKVGETVVAIGNPFGLNQSVTSGIISALGRTSLGIENFENFIQTDAPINPGNSGGALLDIQGNLIGINTAILAPERGSIGIGFAIPSNIAKSIMDQLIQFGDVRRGMLGIGAQDITPDLATAFKLANTSGAVVTLVKTNSPAQKSGLQVGDIITSINNTDIKNANDVVNTVGFLRVNTKVNIDLLRNNKKSSVSATLTDPKALKDASNALDPYFYGVALKNFSLLSPIHGEIKGVLVVSVEPDSHAWQADLRAGDVITSANQQKTPIIGDLQKVASSAKDSVLLNVLRGPGAVFLVVSKEVA